MPTIERLLEYGVYVEDLDRAAAFYDRVFAFPRMVSTGRLVVMDVAGGQVLILFQKGGTRHPLVLDGGQLLPGHDGDGHLHFAFGVHAAELPAWERKLRELEIEIESRINWPRGGKSIYFRDPDHHLLELVTRGTWPNY